MAKLVFISTHGADDVERASLPWALATASLASGHEVHMYLQGPAVELLKKDGGADGLQHEPFPPLAELIELFLEADGNLYGCAPCLQSRNLKQEDLLDGVRIVGGAAMVDQCLSADKVFTYA
jgi:predicted peroxiredoxin